MYPTLSDLTKDIFGFGIPLPVKMFGLFVTIAFWSLCSTRLEQVIINLLSNAVKYSPQQGRIVVSAAIVKHELRFSVTDQGIGIPDGKQAYIFDRFFRVHESSQMFAGLGLGLFISSQIIKQHGGEMGLESEEGKGSTFWFKLPI